MSASAIARVEADAAFRGARRRSRVARALAWLRGGGPRLPVVPPDGSTIRAAGTARGAREVALNAVCATLEPARAEDFDSEFRPGRRVSASRWQRLWLAEQGGESVPPIELVALADGGYAIRDGHHRVSVARARGAQFIDAHIAGPSTADAIRALTSAVRRWLPRPLDERAWTEAFKQLDALLASQAA